MWTFIVTCYALMLIDSYPGPHFVRRLALIPVFLLGWGLSRLITGREMRDLYVHATEPEREHLQRMSASYGAKVGILIAPVAILSMGNPGV